MRFFVIMMVAALGFNIFSGLWKRAEAQPAAGRVEMTLERAQELMRVWGYEVKARMDGPDKLGLFIGQGGGAFFRYDAEKKALVVSGLVKYNIQLMAKYPVLWKKMQDASQREYKSLADGYFELFRNEAYSFEKDLVLITRSFDDASIDDQQFVGDIRWLLVAAYHWRIKRYDEVLGAPEDALIKQADEINTTWPKRPW